MLEGGNIKSAILEKGEGYYTYMKKLFQAIENEQTKYNWLITNYECYPNDEKISHIFSKEYIWISGEQFTEIINKEDFQFIWGVLSGFSKEITLEEVLKYELPFADGYEGFWIDNVELQHPFDNVEIVAWDSSLTIIISKDDNIVEKFMNYFPLSEDLSKQNTKNNSEIALIEKLLIYQLINNNININDEILNKKYFIWNKLYSNRNFSVKEEDILQCINQLLNLKD